MHVLAVRCLCQALEGLQGQGEGTAVCTWQQHSHAEPAHRSALLGQLRRGGLQDGRLGAGGGQGVGAVGERPKLQGWRYGVLHHLGQQGSAAPKGTFVRSSLPAS